MTEQKLIAKLNTFCKYDPETGELIQTAYMYNKPDTIGKPIGNLNSMGYLRIGINNKTYYLHRLIWLLYYKQWPKYHIDHINGNTLDNRIENLRDVTAVGNQRNRKQNSNNTSGTTGVRFTKQNCKWCAYIKVKGKTLQLGYYYNKGLAIKARLEAEIKYGFTKGHGL